jgi:Uncharacterized protein conserved in bacteria
MEKCRISFPRWGSYNIPLEFLFTQGLEVEYVTPPPITKKTLELGSRHSPDYVCSPFKFNIGSYIEAIEVGANTLVQIGGTCRLGYYGELQEQIIKDLGYEVNFVNMARAKVTKPTTFYNEFKKVNPNLSLKKVSIALLTMLKMVELIDEIEDFIRQNVGFEIIDGQMDKLHKDFLEDLRTVKTKKELKEIAHVYKKKFKKVKIKKPKKLIKVGVVGEYYTIMEPFSNHYIEKELAKKGIVVHRWMNVSNSVLHNTGKKQKEYIRGYAKYFMGATSMATIYKALEFAKDKFDGIVHIKSFGCTPEIDAMPVLQKISNDYKIPILYFSFDSQTSETGIQTRLEAFYDMIMMRKESKK